jgi:FkbM family methyltransferase
VNKSSFINQASCFIKNLLMFTVAKKIRFKYQSVNSLFYSTESNRNHYFCVKKRGFKHYRNGLIQRGIEIAYSYGINLVSLSPNDIVIDCGANVGDLFLFLKDKIKQENYIAIEPGEFEFLSLIRNAPNSKCLKLGLSDKKGERDFFMSSKKGDSSLIEPKKFNKKITIKTVNLDFLLGKLNIKHVKLFKLESEGYEPEILEGATASLKNIEYISVDGGYERGKKQEETLSIVLNQLMPLGFSIVFLNLKFGRALLKNCSTASSFH